ncbi:MAG: hypothetical protein QOC97_1732, partial [Chloroflexota bacterium]|nr:hypothetical protein [Chloroflexota bacterium]
MRLGRMPSWCALGLLLTAVVAMSACGDRPSVTPTSISMPSGTPGSTTDPGPSATPGASTAQAEVASPGPSTASLVIGVLKWHLDTALSRAVAFADGGTIVVAGGLTAAGTTGVVRQIDPATGRVSRSGTLIRSVHDAAGAVVGGRL